MIATGVEIESKVIKKKERSASARENEDCEDVGGDVGRAFKETLSLQELNLTNCGGYKLKGLRVARLSGTKSTTAPIACRALPSAMLRSKVRTTIP